MTALPVTGQNTSNDSSTLAELAEAMGYSPLQAGDLLGLFNGPATTGATPLAKVSAPAGFRSNSTHSSGLPGAPAKK